MRGSHCKLYDENLVRNIMISTGLSIMEYVRKHTVVDAAEICDYVENNADNIISSTIEDMNHSTDFSASGTEDFGLDDDWEDEDY